MACLDFEDKTYQPDIEGQHLTHKHSTTMPF